MAATTSHPSFKQPPDETIKVWRYMNMAKFVWSLQNNALFFARSDTLGDPYEGHYSRPLVTALDELTEDTLHPSWTTAGEDKATQLKKAKNMFRMFMEGTKQQKTAFYVSSWHLNERESAAMWRLYTSHEEAICICTTYSNLRDALPSEAMLGKVDYIDYDSTPIAGGNLLNFILHKRMSFAHEREVRAVIWAHSSDLKESSIKISDVGAVVPVNLKTLIGEVYVSPSANLMVRGVVEGLLEKYGHAKQVLQSEVNAPPPY